MNAIAPPSAPPERPVRLHYAWVVAAVTFLVLLCATGVRATPGVLMVPLERELGWSRALISGAVSLNLVLYGLVGPFAAALMERFGTRRSIAASLVVIAAGVALTRSMQAPWQLYVTSGQPALRNESQSSSFEAST